MPQAANITVKDGSNVDKVFTLISPASGDGGISTNALKEGTISAVFPLLTTSATARPTSRNLKIKITVPSSYQDTVTGLTMVNNRVEANLSVTVPADFPEAKKDDAAAFICNLINSPLVKSQIRDALSAT